MLSTRLFLQNLLWSILVAGCFVVDGSAQQSALLSGGAVISGQQALEKNLKDPSPFLVESLSSPKISVSSLQAFYEKRSFAPLWVSAKGLTTAGQNALSTLQQASEEGLDGRVYQPLIDILAKSWPSSLSDPDLAKLETTVTAFMMLYTDQLFGERVDPEKVSTLVHIKAVRLKAEDLLAQKLQEDPSGQTLQTLTINHPQYQHLKEALKIYRKKQQEQGEWPRLTLPASAHLQKGFEGPSVITLKKQLFAQGDLALISEPEKFDLRVEEALKQFQNRHGLEPDGKIGPDTLNALNVSLDDRIKQIVVSMERWRWLPEDQGERYALVNIAGYFLQAFENGQKALEMRVIIGRQYRQTPIFTSAIDYVRFNPVWHVPMSIAIKDKLPLLRKDPGYFAKKGYQILDSSGEAVDAEDVDWSEVSSSSFKYKILQNSGPQNALGRLFFHINTPFDVFFHGTPDAPLFDKAQRSFSSGCIRLQHPETFAKFVLNNDQKWSELTIQTTIDQDQTFDVILKNPLKVYVIYQTVWQDEEGLIHFADDFYKQDSILYQALYPLKN